MNLRKFISLITAFLFLNSAMSSVHPPCSAISYRLPLSDSLLVKGSDPLHNPSQIEQIPLFLLKYGILLDTPVENITNLSLYTFIDDWKQTPYQYGGNDKTGIDCSSFSAILFREIYGINLPRTSMDQFKSAFPISEYDLCEGDLLFFKTGESSVSHVGVYLGNGKFVHASTNKGVTIDSLDLPYYTRSYVGAGRMMEF